MLGPVTGFYDKYELKESLGTGISSVVRRCINKFTNEHLAVKIIDKSNERSESLKGIDIQTQTRAEIYSLSKLAGHPNIIRLIDSYETETFFFLVFELAEGGELFDYLIKFVRLPEKQCKTIMYELLSAVAYIHDINIVHRDIKPENILLDSYNRILLSDFGFAVDISNKQELRELCGTPGYIAPEVIKCSINNETSSYGKEVDLWACGVILFTMLVGFSPFWHRRQVIMLSNIMNGKYDLNTSEWSDINNLVKDLVSKLLVVDPTKRYSAVQALQHPWFEGIVLRKTKKVRKFKMIVFALMTIKSLYFAYTLKRQSLTILTVINDPYSTKIARKFIDTCAFNIYGHWVKRSNEQFHSRAALFQKLPYGNFSNTTSTIQ